MLTCNGVIIPILKQIKDKLKPGGYRPIITLLNTICKILEKIINNRFTRILDKNNYLSLQQSGFRKNRSTVDNLIHIKHEANQSPVNKQIMGLVNLDISKTHVSTWTHNILLKLNQIICKGNLLNVITIFFKNRTFKVKANNLLCEEFMQDNEIPQGSALSVKLFLIAIHDITKCCSLPVTCSLFADSFNFS